MKKEMRLIDANALIYDIQHNYWDYASVDGITATTVLKQTITDIRNQPTVDAVEVVRCKDCKWYNRNEDIMPQSGSCEFHEMVKMDWDFCSRAKMDAKE